MRAQCCQLLSGTAAWHHHNLVVGTGSLRIFGRLRFAVVHPFRTSGQDLLQAQISCADTLSPAAAEGIFRGSGRSDLLIKMVVGLRKLAYLAILR